MPIGFIQLYNPLGNAALSALVAAAPLLALFVLLATGRAPGWAAALVSTIAALVLAVSAWRMPPAAAISAAAYGIAFAVFPILWIVVAALWVFSLSVESGQFSIIRATLAGMTSDRRLQALFIAFAFGAFLEGTAGFGTPVAITAAMLVGLGFDARYAAAICLIANSAPVAFAAAGVPVAVAAQVSGLDVLAISRVLGRQVPLLSLVVPLWLSVILCGWRRSLEVLPAILVAGLAMAATQFVLASFSGPFLTGVASGLVTTAALALFLLIWKPKRIWDFGAGSTRGGAQRASGSGEPAHRGAAPAAGSRGTAEDGRTHPAAGSPEPAGLPRTIRAWSPFLLMSLLILAWGTGPVKHLLDPLGWQIPWPGLHNAMVKAPPIASSPTAYPAVFGLALASSPGTAIFLAGIVSAFLLPGLGARKALRCLAGTLWSLRSTIATVCLVLATAYIMNYAGMSSSLGLAVTATGILFPLFSPLLGWFGVLLTGSDTSSNALFCGLQRTAAEQLGLNPSLMVAANAAGGVTAKMISPQSIAVATASARLGGQEGWLFRFTVWHSVAMALIVSLITLALAYLSPGL